MARHGQMGQSGYIWAGLISRAAQPFVALKDGDPGSSSTPRRLPGAHCQEHLDWHLVTRCRTTAQCQEAMQCRLQRTLTLPTCRQVLQVATQL